MIESRRHRFAMQSAQAALLAVWLAGCGRSGGDPARGAEKLYQGKALGAWISLAERARGEERLQAIRAIGVLGPETKGDGKAAVPILIEALKDEDCRAAAAMSLGGFGPDAAAAAPALAEALRADDGEARSAAAAALERIGSPAIPHLVAAVQRRVDPPFYGKDGSWFDELVRVKPHIIAGGLVAVALAALVVFFLSFKLWIRHRERLARIGMGIDPDRAADAPPPAAAGTATEASKRSGETAPIE